MRPTDRRPIAMALCLAVLSGAVLAEPPDRPSDPAQRIDQRMERLTEGLDLTPEQQAQVRTVIEEQRAAMERLRAETHRRIDALLTDAQRVERDRLQDQRLDRRLDRMAERLSLSADQTAQIRTILKEQRNDPNPGSQTVKERIAAVLTEEQRKEFESLRERRGERRHGGEHGRGPDGGPDQGPDGGPDRGPGPGL